MKHQQGLLKGNCIVFACLLMFIIIVQTGWHIAYGLVSPRSFTTDAVPITITVNSQADKLYLVNHDNSITVLNATTEKPLSQIFLEGYKEWPNPSISLAVNENTNKLYAASQYSEQLYVIDGQEDKVVKNIVLGKYMTGNAIAVNSNTNTIYLATQFNHLILVIDGSTDEIIDRIDIGDHTIISGDVSSEMPAELSVNSHRGLIYATNFAHDLISVIDGSTNKIIANITISKPFAAVINPANNKLYVSHESSESIRVIDGTSFEELAVIPEAYAASFKNTGIAINHETNTIYAANIQPSGAGSIVVVDGNNDKKMDEVKTDFPVSGIAVDPSTGNVYASTDGTAWLYVIDGPSEPTTLPSSTIDVKVGNKTYPLSYNMSNGGSILDISAFTNYPYGGELAIDISSPAVGYLDLIFPRELHDALSFTDHPPVAFVDGIDVAGLVDPSSCDQIPVRVPLEQGSEKIQFVTADILAVHSHPYPPRLQVSKTLVEEGETFRLVLWTDAVECDLSLVKEEKKIHIDVAGRNETDDQGSFSIAIPHELLGGNYTVLVDGEQVTFTEEPYANAAFYSGDIPVSLLVFNYTNNATTIDVIGTSVIPEFGSSIATVIGGITVATVVIASRHYILQRK